MDLGPLAALPREYWDVPYVAARYPGAVPRGDHRRGANCQLWAFEVLAYFGFVIPDLRSDDLWDDTTATRRVSRPRALDLVLHNDHPGSFGAHVGLWVGAGVAHLCREIGRPTIWSHSEFADRPRYAVRIGFTRPVARPDRGRGAREGGP